MKNYYNFWGKANRISPLQDYHLVAYHNLDVAACGYALLSAEPTWRNQFARLLGIDAEQVLKILPLFLSWHDIGKFAEGFQNLIPELHTQLLGRQSTAKYQERHDTSGYRLLTDFNDGLFIEYASKAPSIRNLAGDVLIQDFCSSDILLPILRAICGHHGLPPKEEESLINKQYSAVYRTAALDYLLDVESIFNISNISIVCNDTYDQRSDVLKKFSWFLAGFSVFSDWLGSDTRVFKFCREQISLAEYWQNYAKPSALKIVKDLKISNRARPILSPLQLFPNLSTLTPLQEVIEKLEIDSSPKLVIVEDVTGAGKTEAALLLAHKMLQKTEYGSIYFGLPTMASANGIFSRIIEVYKNFFQDEPSLVLASSKRDLSDPFRALVEQQKNISDIYEEDSQSNSIAWFSDSKKKALLASFGVGTIDQALIGVLPLKHQSLRLIGLSRGILIIDEVHAYDEYVSTLLQYILEFLGFIGAPAILLSATLPIEIKNKFIRAYQKGLGSINVELPTQNPYPCLEIVSKSDVNRIECDTRAELKRTVQLVYETSEANIDQIILSAVKTGQCVCWIRNTVSDATEAYQRIKDQVDGTILFHSRFCFGHRKIIEDQVLSLFGKKGDGINRAGRIVIATQVVEQSLDLDFDLLISDLAPIDLIIQRAGRLHRHRRGLDGAVHNKADARGDPIMIVLGPDPDTEIKKNWFSSMFEKASFVYKNHVRLWLTAKLIKQYGSLTSPTDLRKYVEYVYGEIHTNIPEELKHSEDIADGEEKAKKGSANMNAVSLDRGYSWAGHFWSTDVETPTRLTEGVQEMATLIVWDGNKIEPMVSDQMGMEWELSEVGVKIGLEQDFSCMANGLQLQGLLKTLQEKPQHKWRKFIVMQSTQDSKNYFTILQKRGKKLELNYSETKGLQYRD